MFMKTSFNKMDNNVFNIFLSVKCQKHFPTKNISHALVQYFKIKIQSIRKYRKIFFYNTKTIEKINI